MTPLPPWLAEKLKQNKKDGDSPFFYKEGIADCYNLMREEMDLLVAALEDISGCYDQNSMDHANKVLRDHEEKFPDG